MPTTTSEPLTPTTISAPTASKESANEFTLPPNLELTDYPGDAAVDVAAATTVDAVAGDGDEILQNIIRSNERLAKELAKMPPLPKISSYKKSRARAEAPTPIAAASATAATPASSKIKCFCPSFMRHRHEHEHIHTLRRRSSGSNNSSETNVACCRNNSRATAATATSSASPTAATSFSKARTQTTHSKSMKCHGHESTVDTHHQHEHHRTTSSSSTTIAEPHHHPGCCHPCKTDPLPWLQQHLVLNQILSSSSATACQPTCQVQHLTVDADSMAATSADATSSTACRGPGSNALSASIKPKLYFEQLLRRDGCHKKPRPPVKVDVNVRLVPKQPKPKVTRSLNETFVKEVDEVAQAMNETFVKETSPELARIDEQLAELESNREREDHEDHEEVDEETEEQEQATKLW